MPGVLALLNTANRTPSKRARPSSVAIQRKPSPVCWMPVMMFCGRPASAVHDSNPYWARAAVAWLRIARSESATKRMAGTLGFRCTGGGAGRWRLYRPRAPDAPRSCAVSNPRRFLGLPSGLHGEWNARVHRMSMRSRRVRHGLVASVVVLLMTGLRLPMLAQRAPEPGSQGKAGGLTTNFDIRSSAALRTQLLQRLGRSQPAEGATKLRQANDALATLRSDLPRATATISPFTGGAELVRNPRGALTPPAPGMASAAIVSGFLETHAALYGLAAADLATIRFLGESVNRSNGLRMLRAEQAIGGIPVFQSDARFILDREGRLIRTTGRLVSPAGAGGSAPAAAIPASAALVSAMRSVGDPPVTGDVASRLVYFPLASGVLVLAYEQMTYTDGAGDYLTVVDATAGTLLWRKNVRNYQSAQQARFSVYVQADGVTPADSPAPLSPTTVTPGAGTQYPGFLARSSTCCRRRT